MRVAILLRVDNSVLNQKSKIKTRFTKRRNLPTKLKDTPRDVRQYLVRRKLRFTVRRTHGLKGAWSRF